jgi:hypothetical protein
MECLILVFIIIDYKAIKLIVTEITVVVFGAAASECQVLACVLAVAFGMALNLF